MSIDYVPQKLYVVTEGSYSDYHICAIFRNKELAEDYIKDQWASKGWGTGVLNYIHDYSIEEYETQDWYQGEGSLRPESCKYVKATFSAKTLELTESKLHDQDLAACSFGYCKEGITQLFINLPISRTQEATLKACQDMAAQYKADLIMLGNKIWEENHEDGVI